MRFFLLCALTSLAAAVSEAQTAVGGSSDQAAWDPRGAWFADVSEASGALFKHQDSAYSYAMGSGVGWIDLEEDGDLDLIILSASGPGLTLRNDGGTFTDVTSTIGPFTQPDDEPIGIICADYDQDGLTDAYFCNVRENRLFRNLGNGFLDVAASLNATGGNTWSTSASWADFDLDGDLDLYIGNYIRILNFPYHYGAPNVLLENRGSEASPQFLNVAPALGVDDTAVFGDSVPGYPYTAPTGAATAGCALSTCTLDYDEDGDPDLMVGNDFGLWVTPNKLYRNDQAGAGMAFANVTSQTGFDTRPHYNMGIVPCDYDHDGDWDFYKSNLGDNLLLRNDGGTFVDATYIAGPASGEIDGGLLISSWGMIFQDFDNDGWEDIVVANGYIPASTFIDNEVRIENHLWRNRGDGTFAQILNELAGHGDPGPARGIAQADYDVDGLLDFYVQNNGAPYVAYPKDRSRLFRNTGMFAPGSWLELDVAGRLSNREGFGTRIEVEAGGTTWRRQVLCDPVFLSSPSPIVHVGLGDVAVVERVTARWPSGIEQTWFDVDVDQLVVLLEPAVTVAAIEPLEYTGGVLKLRGTVQNHAEQSQSALATFRLVLGGPGGGDPPLLELVQAADVGAGARMTIQVDQPIDPALYASFQGASVEVQVEVTATGAGDEERATQTLP